MNGKAFLAEFIGTFALVFVGVGAIVTNNLLEGGPGLISIALAHGLTLAVMISATAAISGGHINPAVTFGALITGKIDAVNGIGYIIAQCLGGIVAAALIKVVMPTGATFVVNMGTPELGTGVTLGMGLLMEIILTFFLVFAIFGTAVDPRAPKIGGFGIGLAIGFDILVGGPLTGASMNPARTFGPGLAAGVWDEHIIYWIGPIVGGLIAGLIYQHCLMDKGDSGAESSEG